MTVAIIGAMEEEIQYLKEHINLERREEYNGDIFYFGSYCDKNIILTQSHVGMVAASSQLTSLANRFDFDLVINVGVCGGFSEKNNIFDIIIGDKISCLDADARHFGHYRYGQIPANPPYFQGNNDKINTEKTQIPFEYGDVLSSDKFVVSMKQIEYQLGHFDDFDVRCIDMESAAFCQIALKYHKDIVIIRCISDLIGCKEQREMYDNLFTKAADKSSQFVLDILK